MPHRTAIGALLVRQILIEKRGCGGPTELIASIQAKTPRWAPMAKRPKTESRQVSAAAEADHDEAILAELQPSRIATATGAAGLIPRPGDASLGAQRAQIEIK